MLKNVKVTLAVFGLAVAASAPAAAQDWSGFYGGLSFSSNNTAYSDAIGGVPATSYDLEGNQFGGFLGYNLQRGALVYGGELAYSKGDIEAEAAFPGNQFEKFLDLKARVGYAAGQALFYGTLGWSAGDYRYAGPVTNNPVRADGWALGAGVDFMVSDRIFVGAEYLHRKTEIDEGGIGGFPTYSAEMKTDTLSLRMGMKF